MNLSVTRAEGWSSDVTACTVVRLEVGETGVQSRDTDGREIGYRRDECGVRLINTSARLVKSALPWGPTTPVTTA